MKDTKFVNPRLKEFMNQVWNATYINGYGEVRSKRVTYGSSPDIQFIVWNDGPYAISAKWMYEMGITFE